MLLVLLSSCVMTKLNNDCPIGRQEIKFNWDTSSISKWNLTCIAFLERLESNQKCFIGMDTNQIIKIFGSKYVSTLYQDGGRALQFPIQPNRPVYPNINSNSALDSVIYFTLDFLIFKDKVRKVGYTTFSQGKPVN